ncbi:hypothetical protein SPSIL_020150 [Sporomusa silvacetica DSM 10669]|uniref:Uncharacterized protein n=1 Tax=Sporomusa silvacetica DSM 10669 TaxID=1123289 RepID=A0ABZ3IKE4_9FIRM|nr:hypothetical protein [Sporomusa silvacetica]OZC18732.1 hypothetical protein SPSIL_23410 [Sporomusa silvacetica DSM 10669]
MMVIDGYKITISDGEKEYDGDNPPEWFLERLAYAFGYKYVPKEKKKEESEE